MADGKKLKFEDQVVVKEEVVDVDDNVEQDDSEGAVGGFIPSPVDDQLPLDLDIFGNDLVNLPPGGQVNIQPVVASDSSESSEEEEREEEDQDNNEMAFQALPNAQQDMVRPLFEGLPANARIILARDVATQITSLRNIEIDPLMVIRVQPVEAPAAAAGGDNRTVSVKTIQALTKFSGEDPAYTWANFLIHLKVASMNQTFTDPELKMILLQSLTGSALAYLSAKSEWLSKPYDFILQQLAEVYQPRVQQEISAVKSMTQLPKETVRTFQARLLNAASGMRPQEPPQKRFVTIDDAEFFTTDFYILENQRYLAEKARVESFLTHFFLQGLRTEIRANMKTQQFADLDSAVSTAIDAEIFVDSGLVMHMNHISISETPAQEEKKEATKPTVNFMEGKHKPRTCFECGSPDHFVRFCPRKNGGNGRNSRSGRNTPDNRRNRSSGRDGDDRLDINSLTKQMSKIVSYMGRRGGDRSGRYNRSRSRGRYSSQSGSRSGSRSRSHGRSGSRHRSGSRRSGRKGSKNGY
jgi:hypothetical protein